MRPSLSFLCSIVLLGSVLGDIISIPGTQRVMPVFAQADLVCNCFVESVRTASEQPIERMGKHLIQRHILAKVRVDDAYNKNFPTKAEIYVAFEEEVATTASISTISKAERALMFLKGSSTSSYEFADRTLGVTPFASLPVQSSASGIFKLQLALADVLQVGSRDDQIKAMRLLQGFDELSSDTLTKIRLLSNSADSETALSAIAVLLKAKDSGSVSRVETYFRTHKGSPMPVAVLSIGGDLGQVSDIKELPSLEALASSEILSIKLGAIAGVRRIRSPRSAKTLIERLDDPNADVRFLAVITLSEIFSKNGDYAPTMYQFDQNPEFYTTEWKTWWAENGRDLPR